MKDIIKGIGLVVLWIGMVYGMVTLGTMSSEAADRDALKEQLERAYDTNLAGKPQGEAIAHLTVCEDGGVVDVEVLNASHYYAYHAVVSAVRQLPVPDLDQDCGEQQVVSISFG